MGAFDQAARFAAHADPVAVLDGLAAGAAPGLAFRGWFDTRTVPLPGGPDRTADLVAALDDPSGGPTLLVLEFQSQHDPNKLDVALEEVGTLRGHARHGGDRKGKYRVLSALVYLRGRCPEPVLDMTIGNGFGTRHAPLIWNVGDGDAAATVERASAGATSWGTLFWVPLMAGGSDPGVIRRWKDAAAHRVADRRSRGNLAGIALVFADLVGRRADWKRELEGFEVTESEVVNEWIGLGEARGLLAAQRQNLLELLDGRFPGAVPGDVRHLIRQQESLPVLRDWFTAAVRAYTVEQFLAAVKK